MVVTILTTSGNFALVEERERRRMLLEPEDNLAHGAPPGCNSTDDAELLGAADGGLVCRDNRRRPNSFFVWNRKNPARCAIFLC